MNSRKFACGWSAWVLLIAPLPADNSGQFAQKSPTASALANYQDELWLVGTQITRPFDSPLGSVPTSQVGRPSTNCLKLPSHLILGSWAVSNSKVPFQFQGLQDVELAGVCRHPGGEKKLCFLTVDGRLLGADLDSMQTQPIFEEMSKALGLGQAQPQFRALFNAHDRLFVVNDLDPTQGPVRGRASGRLAEWDWRGAWRVVDQSPYVDVSGTESATGLREDLIFALGYDAKSLLLRVWHQNQWRRYRLPWNWPPRSGLGNGIREMQAGRWLMSAFGNLYELQPPQEAGFAPHLRPICRLQQPVLDFTFYRGGVAMILQEHQKTGQLRLVTMEDLVRGPQSCGTGGVWQDQLVRASEVSEPFLMAGFGRKTLHLTNEGTEPMEIDLLIDARGNDEFQALHRISLPAGAYVPYIFPEGFSGAWWRLQSVQNGKITAFATYE